MKLQDFLDETEMSATSLAVRAGVSVSTITRLINGERKNAGIDLLTKIMIATKGRVTPNDFAVIDMRKMRYWKDA